MNFSDFFVKRGKKIYVMYIINIWYVYVDVKLMLFNESKKF